MGRMIFYARLFPLLLALVVAVTFMVLPWPDTLRKQLFDVAVVAAVVVLAVRWYRSRTRRQISSDTNTNLGDRWTSTS